jgi:hypothetical protein
MTKITATFNDNETITYGGHRDVTFCWRVVRWDGITLTGFSMSRYHADKRAEQVACEGSFLPELPKRGAVPMSYRIHKDRENMELWGTTDRKELKAIRVRMCWERRSNSTIELSPVN